MKNKHIYIIILFLFIVYLSFSINEYYQLASKSVVETSYKNNNLLRLHVIADSNSPYDQYLKRKTRNIVISYFQNKAQNKVNENDLIKIEEEILHQFNQIKSLNDFKTEYGYFYFPRRRYNNISLSAGNYKAIKVELGDAKGANWWCVLVPNLCVLQKTDEMFLNEKENIDYKFKIVEVINELKINRFNLVDMLKKDNTSEIIFDDLNETLVNNNIKFPVQYPY